MTTSLIEARRPIDAQSRSIHIPRPTVATAVVAAIVTVAVGGIILQQIVHTPWGLPGHRGLFWLAPLIAARWAIDRPSTALGIAAPHELGLRLRKRRRRGRAHERAHDQQHRRLHRFEHGDDK